MSNISDLPSTVRFLPQSWTWTASGGHKEHFLGWEVPFADFNAFLTVALFTQATVTVGPGATITRVFPLVCPLDPTLVALEVRPGQPPQINQRGQSHPDGPWEEVLDEEDEPTGVYRPRVAAPPWNLVYPLVRFGVPTFPLTGPQAFLEITEESHDERVTVPGHSYWLETDGGVLVERVAQDLGIAPGSSSYRITWHDLPDLAAAQAVLHPLLGRVNASAVTIPKFNVDCPAGTLKAASKTGGITVFHGNSSKSTCSLQVAYMPWGWNRAVASATGYAGQLLNVNSDNGPPFPSADFTTLFNPTV